MPTVCRPEKTAAKNRAVRSQKLLSRKINILRDAFQDIKTDVKRLALTF